MTTNIKGGLVSFEDGRKADTEYTPPRKVRVELRFDVPDDAANGTDDLDLAADIAVRKVAAMLGQKLPPLTGKERTPEEIAAADKAKTASAAKRPPAAPKGDKTDAPKADAATAVDGELTVEPAAAANTTAAADPKPSVPPSDSLDDLLGGAEPAKPITDADLTGAITRKNATLKAPPKIRELIVEFSPKDKAPSASLIPQEKRAEFLAKLEALTA